MDSACALESLWATIFSVIGDAFVVSGWSEIAHCWDVLFDDFWRRASSMHGELNPRRWILVVVVSSNVLTMLFAFIMLVASSFLGTSSVFLWMRFWGSWTLRISLRWWKSTSLLFGGCHPAVPRDFRLGSAFIDGVFLNDTRDSLSLCYCFVLFWWCSRRGISCSFIIRILFHLLLF